MKLEWITFWIASFACYRGTVLITRCLGPWDIFKRIRSIDRCSKLLTCPYCVSVYLGALTVYALYLCGLREPWPMSIMLAMAFSAVTIALDRTFSADHNP